jgi:hypothetical protein
MTISLKCWAYLRENVKLVKKRNKRVMNMHYFYCASFSTKIPS